MFDPRLTEEYCGLAGMPWSDQDASGEIAAMAIGAALWGLFNQTGEFGYRHDQGRAHRLPVRLSASVLAARAARCSSKARATGLRVTDWQNVILVNMLGQRFYDETGGAVHRQQLQRVKSVRSRQLSQRQEHHLQPQQLPQRGDGRHRRRPQWRRPDLGDLRCRRGRARELGARSRRSSTSPKASSSAPTRSPSSPRRSA